MRLPQPARVLLWHCDEYDPKRIHRIVGESMDALGIRPHGRTLVKPNLVSAGPLFEHAHTRSEFMEGVLLALQERADRVEELAVGERSGITIPTRYTFRQSGLDAVLDRLKVQRYCFEEVTQVEVALTHANRLRDTIFVPEPVARADFFVNCPKFKSHPWTTVTFGMKNYIGIQDDRHRLIDHDHALDRKVADLQHVIQPELLAVDAIIAGEGRMLTPLPRSLNLVIVGNNQAALDAVCSQILDVDPLSVGHLRHAHEDGFGPMALAEIDIGGDVTLEQARERARGFQVGLVRIEKYFEGSKIQAYAGPPPGHGPGGYCWGGCPGVMEEVIEVLRLADPECDAKAPRIHLVFGKYDGPLDIQYGEKAVFVGDCVEWEGNIGGQLVQLRSRYTDRSLVDPHEAKHTDIYRKMASTLATLQKLKQQPYARISGCPVSIAELIFLVAQLGNIKNPYFDSRNVVDFNRSYLAWRAATTRRRLSGKPYQRAGLGERGLARPELDKAE